MPSANMHRYKAKDSEASQPPSNRLSDHCLKQFITPGVGSVVVLKRVKSPGVHIGIPRVQEPFHSRFTVLIWRDLTLSSNG